MPVRLDLILYNRKMNCAWRSKLKREHVFTYSEEAQESARYRTCTLGLPSAALEVDPNRNVTVYLPNRTNKTMTPSEFETDRHKYKRLEVFQQVRVVERRDSSVDSAEDAKEAHKTASGDSRPSDDGPPGEGAAHDEDTAEADSTVHEEGVSGA